MQDFVENNETDFVASPPSPSPSLAQQHYSFSELLNSCLQRRYLEVPEGRVGRSHVPVGKKPIPGFLFLPEPLAPKSNSSYAE